MKTIYIDTNVILRFLLNDLPDQYEQAKKLFSSTSHQRVVCASEVLAEVSFVLTSFYKIPKAEVSALVIQFVRTTPIEVQNKNAVLWVFEHYAETNLAYIDLLITKYAHDDKGMVFSFDQRLMKMQKKLI